MLMYISSPLSANSDNKELRELAWIKRMCGVICASIYYEIFLDFVKGIELLCV